MRCFDKFIQADLEISRRKNVVGVRGKAKRDWKKSADPESRASRHPGKVCMNVANPRSLQTQPDVDSLIKTKEIGAPAPLIESRDSFGSEFSLCRSSLNFIQ